MAQATSTLEQARLRNRETFDAWQEKRKQDTEKLWLAWKALAPAERERIYAARDRQQRVYHERYSFWPGKTTSEF